MSQTKLSKEKEYLMYVVPKLNQEQTNRVLDTINQICRERKRTGDAQKNTAYQDLMAMTGCRNAKKQLTAILTASAMERIVSSRKGIRSKQYYHAVFRGNAGCAKTTCARLYADALAYAGVTKMNSFAEITRASICGRYVGETAPRVREIFEKNRGGVIFVDEAYSLFDGEQAREDYGKEAIDEMIVCMENVPETVVIFAGYPQEMDRFLDANPGLRSRIPFCVDFEDYTTEELLQITMKISEQKGFRISAEAVKKLEEIFSAAREEQGFGNGRFCRNLVEEAIRKKGIELGVVDAGVDSFLYSGLYSDETLFTLGEDCFENRWEKSVAQPRRMGF